MLDSIVVMYLSIYYLFIYLFIYLFVCLLTFSLFTFYICVARMAIKIRITIGWKCLSDSILVYIGLNL